MMGQQLCAAGKFSSKSTHRDFGKSFSVLIESATDHIFPREKHIFCFFGTCSHVGHFEYLKKLYCFILIVYSFSSCSAE